MSRVATVISSDDDDDVRVAAPPARTPPPAHASGSDGGSGNGSGRKRKRAVADADGDGADDSSESNASTSTSASTGSGPIGLSAPARPAAAAAAGADGDGDGDDAPAPSRRLRLRRAGDTESAAPSSQPKAQPTSQPASQPKSQSQPYRPPTFASAAVATGSSHGAAAAAANGKPKASISALLKPVAAAAAAAAATASKSRASDVAVTKPPDPPPAPPAKPKPATSAAAAKHSAPAPVAAAPAVAENGNSNATGSSAKAERKAAALHKRKRRVAAVDSDDDGGAADGGDDARDGDWRPDTDAADTGANGSTRSDGKRRACEDTAVEAEVMDAAIDAAAAAFDADADADAAEPQAKPKRQARAKSKGKSPKRTGSRSSSRSKIATDDAADAAGPASAKAKSKAKGKSSKTAKGKAADTGKPKSGSIKQLLQAQPFNEKRWRETLDEFELLDPSLAAAAAAASGSSAGAGVKPTRGTSSSSSSTGKRNGSFTFAAPRALPPASATSRKDETELWIDKYAPATEDDLCVHARKLADIKAWLNAQMELLNPARRHAREAAAAAAAAAAGSPTAPAAVPSQPQQRVAHQTAVQRKASAAAAATATGAPAPARALPIPPPRHAQKMLILSGPPGCGKATIMRVLARSMQFQLVRWAEPVDEYDDSGRAVADFDDGEQREYLRFESALQRFRKFLLQSNKYGLKLSAANAAPASSASAASASDASPTGDKVILIDEYPNIGKYGGENSGDLRREFQSIIRDALASTRCVMVFLLTSEHESGSKQELDQLFDTDIQSNPRVAQIKCNAVSATGLKKALNRVIRGERLKVSPAVLNEIIETSKGDVRNAVHTLQFQTLMAAVPTAGDDESPRATPRVKRQKTSSDAATAAGDAAAADDPASGAAAAERPLDDSDDDGAMPRSAARERAAEGQRRVGVVLSGRDETFSVFHAVGKIMHAKASHSAEAVVERSGLGAAVFADWVFENYLEYLPTNDFATVEHATDTLSDADLFARASHQKYGDSTTALSDHFASSMACRGFLRAKKGVSDVPLSWKEKKFRQFRGPQSHKVRRAAEHTAATALSLFQNTPATPPTDGFASASTLLVWQLPYLTAISVPPPPPMAVLRNNPAAAYRHATLTPNQVETLRVLCDYSKKLEPRRLGDAHTARARSELLRDSGAPVALPPPAEALPRPAAAATATPASVAGTKPWQQRPAVGGFNIRALAPAAAAASPVAAAAFDPSLDANPLDDDPIE